MQHWFETVLDAERGRLALFLPMALAAGVIWYLAMTSEPDAMLSVRLILGAGTAWAVARSWRGPGMLAAAALAAGLGIAAGQLATWRAAPVVDLPRRATIITATVAAVEWLPVGRRVTLDSASLDGGPALPRRLRVRLRATDDSEISAGDHIQLRALLRRPAPPAFPGAWDLQRDDFYDGLGGYGTALGPLTLVAHAAPTGAGAYLQGLRETITARITAQLNGSEAAIAMTLLTGSAARIPQADRTAFRDAGLAHLLAIAGLHIGIVMGLVFGATRWCLSLSELAALFWPLKAIAAISALAAGLAYLVLTGGHVPIQRSFAMACLVTLSLLAGRRAASLRGLALAMAGIVVASPQAVIGVSFQMSFSAVLALIAGYAALQPRLLAWRGDGTKGRGLALHIVMLALTSALAGTASAPYAAYHFGLIQLYFVAGNMLAVPITALLVMPAGLLSLALMPLHLEGLALAPMGWGISAILAIARFVTSWPDATVRPPPMPPWGILAYSLGLAWLCLLRSRLRLGGLAVIALGLAAPLTLTPPDLMVSADARLIGLHTPQQTQLLRQGRDPFTEDAWRLVWPNPPQPLTCTSPVCLLQPTPTSTIALLTSPTAQAACTAQLIISANPIHLRCPDNPQQIDRFTVWREGSQAIWLTNPPTIVSDQAKRGTRPWVLGPTLYGATPKGTTPALTE